MVSAALAAALFLQAAPVASAAIAPAVAAAPAPTPVSATVTASVAPVTVNGAKTKAANLEPGRLICHNETVLGTLFPKKVCATQREMAERRSNDQQVVQDFQRATIVGPPPWTP